MNQPSDAAPEKQRSRSRSSRPSRRRRRSRSTRRPILPAPSAPILPAQSREDTDVGWGDYAERDDSDRLLRDRPPHWDNA